METKKRDKSKGDLESGYGTMRSSCIYPEVNGCRRRNG